MTRATAVAMAASVLWAATACAATNVYLQREATVQGTMIRLGDVALVEGDRAEELKSLVVCPSPLAGGSVLLDRQKIGRRLLAAVGGAEVELAGADSCTVSRADVQQEAACPAAVAAPAGAGRRLEQMLREAIQRRIDLPQDRYRIEFDARDAATLAMTDGEQSFRVELGAAEKVFGTGISRVEVTGRQGQDRSPRTLFVRYRVVQLASVVVAARDIRPGEVLGREDVRLERREFRDERVDGLRHLENAVGATARSALIAGQVLCDNDVTQTLLVRRGDMVTVYVYGRGFTLKTRCRALETGERDATIALEGMDGRGKFYARVIDARTAELRLADAPAKQALVQPASAGADAAERTRKGES